MLRSYYRIPVWAWVWLSFGTVSLLGYNALTWRGQKRTGEGLLRNLGDKRIDF